MMGSDAGVKPHEANQMISDAVDLLAQIGIRDEVRRVTAISNIAMDLKNGDGFYEPIFRNFEESSADGPSFWKLRDLS